MTDNVLRVKLLEHECLSKAQISQFLQYRQICTSSILQAFYLKCLCLLIIITSR